MVRAIALLGVTVILALAMAPVDARWRATAHDATPGVSGDAAGTPAFGIAATPFPVGVVAPFPGKLASAGRSFAAADESPEGVGGFVVFVIEFGSADEATAALAPLIAQFVTASQPGVQEAVPAHVYGDETAAYIVAQAEPIVRAAWLVVRDGRFLHLWVAAGGDPLPALVKVGDRVLPPARTGTPAAAASPASSSEGSTLLDRLPDVGDLPAGFILAEEWLDAVATSATPAP